MAHLSPRSLTRHNMPSEHNKAIEAFVHYYNNHCYFCQRVEINIFDGHFKAGMPVAAAPAGLTYQDPVGCLIAGALEAISFHKGFQQIDGMTLFPIQSELMRLATLPRM